MKTQHKAPGTGKRALVVIALMSLGFLAFVWLIGGMPTPWDGRSAEEVSECVQDASPYYWGAFDRRMLADSRDWVRVNVDGDEWVPARWGEGRLFRSDMDMDGVPDKSTVVVQDAMYAQTVFGEWYYYCHPLNPNGMSADEVEAAVRSR